MIIPLLKGITIMKRTPTCTGRRGPPWEPGICKLRQTSFQLLNAARGAKSSRAFLFMGRFFRQGPDKGKRIG